MDIVIEQIMVCWTLLSFGSYLAQLFFMIAILGLEWCWSVNVTQIYSCCEIEFTTTQYLFRDYNLSSEELTATHTTCCGNISVDEYFNQMDNTLQLKIDTAESIMKFVQASPFLIIVHNVFTTWFVCCEVISHNFRRVIISTTSLCIMVFLTAVSTTGVIFYATIYRDQIGFTGLGIGFMTAAFICGSTIVFDVILIVCACLYKEDRHQTNDNKALPDKSSTTVIKTDIWAFVKHGDNRNSVLGVSADQTTVLESSRNRELVLDISTISGDSGTIYQNNVYTNDAMQDILKTVQQSIVEFYKTSTDEIINNFQIFINAMWNPHLVGIGVDAYTLSHTSLKVINVINNNYNDFNFLINKHILMRHSIQNVIKRFGPLPCLADFDCKPIQTTEFKRGTSIHSQTIIGMRQLDSCLNEYLLFHGTSETNAESILKYGFDISKVQRSFLGRGIYFAESPVKADQYIGAGTTGCMLVCRVILGNFIIRKTHPGNELRDWTNLPCSRCFWTLHCKQHHLPSERFDSLIYDNPKGLFREFVVFNPDQILVERVVKYTRVTNTVLEIRL